MCSALAGLIILATWLLLILFLKALLSLLWFLFSEPRCQPSSHSPPLFPGLLLAVTPRSLSWAKSCWCTAAQTVAMKNKQRFAFCNWKVAWSSHGCVPLQSAWTPSWQESFSGLNYSTCLDCKAKFLLNLRTFSKDYERENSVKNSQTQQYSADVAHEMQHLSAVRSKRWNTMKAELLYVQVFYLYHSYSSAKTSKCGFLLPMIKSSWKVSDIFRKY